MHVTACPQNPEAIVEGQESLKQVLFGVEPVLVHNQLSFILCRQEDVVDVDHHSRLEPRKYFEKFILNITADLDHVTGVDEQNVVLAEHCEL